MKPAAAPRPRGRPAGRGATDRRAGERRRGIEDPVEDDGHPTGQRVPHHSAADAGEHAEKRRGERAEAVVDGLEGAGDAEEREPEGVEERHHPLEAAERRVEEEGQQARPPPGTRR